MSYPGHYREHEAGVAEAIPLCAALFGMDPDSKLREALRRR